MMKMVMIMIMTENRSPEYSDHHYGGNPYNHYVDDDDDGDCYSWKPLERQNYSNLNCDHIFMMNLWYLYQVQTTLIIMVIEFSFRKEHVINYTWWWWWLQTKGHTKTNILPGHSYDYGDHIHQHPSKNICGEISLSVLVSPSPYCQN